MGRELPGGIVMGNTAFYDWGSRILLGSFYRGVADDVAAVIDGGGPTLEIGCGPGHLAVEIAARGLDVTAVDLDEAMIERAQTNAHRANRREDLQVSFEVADAASLPYRDETFDLVTSTLSLHHWADPGAALSEIARVLKPDGRALIWDFGTGGHALHGDMPDPSLHFDGSPLRLVSATPWRWPFGFSPTQRIEVRRRDHGG
jgi:ubiquinone/menaquinone biosynthesis C-methylase UbiE